MDFLGMLQLALWLGHIAPLPSVSTAESCSDTSGSDVLSSLQTHVAHTSQVKTGDSNTLSSLQNATLPPVMIPLRLFQTGKAGPSTSLEQMRVQKWMLANPGLEYVFMDDDAGRNYLLQSWGQRYATAFDKLKVGAFRADFLRICYLAGEGGFYSDLDNEPGEVSLVELQATGAQVIVPQQCALRNSAPPPCTDGFDPLIWNAFLGSVPRNPVLLELVQSALHNIENCLRPRLMTVPPGQDHNLQAAWDALSITGPVHLRPLAHDPGALILPVVCDGFHSSLAMMKSLDGALRGVSKANWTSSAHFASKDHWLHNLNQEDIFKQCDILWDDNDDIDDEDDDDN